MATRMDRHKQEVQKVVPEKTKTKERTEQKAATTSATASVGPRPHQKKKKKRKKWPYIVGAIVLLLLLVGGKVFMDAHHMMKSIQDEPSSSAEIKKANEQVAKRQPLAILLLGTDDGALNRAKGGGRSDTMIVMALNPKEKKSLMVSLERDSYVYITNKGSKDKLNSAYVYGGPTNSMETVERMLNIPLDYYVTINMKGLEDLVDAVGGVTVDSNISFDYEGYHFQKGPNKIETGKEALAFTRMRYDDPEGDYGRQKRQRALITAIIKKMGSGSSILHYKSILNTLENNMKTDIPSSTMVKLASGYRSCFEHMQSDYLHGTGFMQNGISYQNVSQDLPRVQKELQQILEIQN